MGKGATSHRFFFIFSTCVCVRRQSHNSVAFFWKSKTQRRDDNPHSAWAAEGILAYCQTITPHERLKLNSLDNILQSLREDGDNMIQFYNLIYCDYTQLGRSSFAYYSFKISMLDLILLSLNCYVITVFIYEWMLQKDT